MNNEELGCFIDIHAKLNTTAQTMHYLRRNGYNDNQIRGALEHCSKGNAIAIESLLQKVPTEYVHIERELDENKDIIGALRE